MMWSTDDSTSPAYSPVLTVVARPRLIAARSYCVAFASRSRMARLRSIAVLQSVAQALLTPTRIA